MFFYLLCACNFFKAYIESSETSKQRENFKIMETVVREKLSKITKLEIEEKKVGRLE